MLSAFFISLLAAFFVSIMAVFGRWAGGGFGWDKVVAKVKAINAPLGSFVGRVPEILISVPFGFAAYYTAAEFFSVDDYRIGLLGFVISYVAYEMGHGNFFHDGVGEHTFPDDPESIEKITGLHSLLPKLGFAPRSAGYCRIMMGVKWFLFGLPALPLAPVFAVIGPVSYWLSFRPLYSDNIELSGSGLAEFLSAGLAGAMLCVYAVILFAQ